MLPSVTPQLLGNAGIHALKRAIAEPERDAFEVKVDGCRGLAPFTTMDCVVVRAAGMAVQRK